MFCFFPRAPLPFKFGFWRGCSSGSHTLEQEGSNVIRADALVFSHATLDVQSQQWSYSFQLAPHLSISYCPNMAIGKHQQCSHTCSCVCNRTLLIYRRTSPTTKQELRRIHLLRCNKPALLALDFFSVPRVDLDLLEKVSIEICSPPQRPRRSAVCPH